MAIAAVSTGFLIEPPPPAELRSRAAARREVSQPTRAMRSNCQHIAERGIIAFGNGVPAEIRADPDRADALYRRVAEQ